MMAGEFESKLRKLNSNFHIDFSHRSFPEHPDFPASGLYHRGKFVMGVPQGNIFKESVWGLNLEKLELEGYASLPEKGSWLDNDWVEYQQKHNAGVVDDRIISRGYGFILSELVRLGYLNWEDTERVFDIHLTPKAPEHVYPRRYLGLHFEGE